jgi:hypothetical protein
MLPIDWYRVAKITEGHNGFILRVKKSKDVTVLGQCDSEHKSTKIVFNIDKHFSGGKE